MSDAYKDKYYIGLKLGSLTLVDYAPGKTMSNGRTLSVWVCECDCGNVIKKNAKQLSRMTHPSCGCVRVYRRRKPKTQYAVDPKDFEIEHEIMIPGVPLVEAEPKPQPHWLWRTEEKFRLTSSGMVFQIPTDGRVYEAFNRSNQASPNK